MRDLTWWALPGLIIVGPLALLLHAWPIGAACAVGLLSAPVIGLLLHQAVRWRFEADGNGFRSPQRAALAAIIERGNLGNRADAGDVAYQIYELVFYEQPNWGPIRDHLHRCWHYVFWFRTIAVACAIGAGISLLAVFGSGRPLIAALLAFALPAFSAILYRKAEQTLAALHLFDRGLILTNWPLYEQKLASLAG